MACTREFSTARPERVSEDFKKNKGEKKHDTLLRGKRSF
jgi:hypothetical protein